MGYTSNAYCAVAIQQRSDLGFSFLYLQYYGNPPKLRQQRPFACAVILPCSLLGTDVFRSIVTESLTTFNSMRDKETNTLVLYLFEMTDMNTTCDERVLDTIF